MTKQKNSTDLQQELDDILAWFQSDSANLDEAVDKFKRGKEIVVLLEKHLEQAKNTITLVTSQNE
jgi:exodeoxyribonuclease VII small subunit